MERCESGLIGTLGKRVNRKVPRVRIPLSTPRLAWHLGRLASCHAFFMKLQQNVQLSSLTTIGLGGKAQYFVVVSSADELREALEYAKKENLEIHILGGGSNTIFPDKEFEKLIIKIDIKGLLFQETNSHVHATVGAGERWDDLVKICVENDYSGIECLSGIPGSVGATPIQNVGAYGQEVKDVIIEVKAVDIKSFAEVSFTNKECEFGYRTSRFKTTDKGKYIITEVVFQLQKEGVPTIKYAELQRAVEARHLASVNSADKLQTIRNAVLELRAKKSMVINSEDPNTNSCGSFFTNPILTKEEFKELEARAEVEVPFYPEEDKIKVSAAWLIEQAGWKKGHQENGVGISENHSLALVNKGGTTAELMAFAEKIKKSVEDKFGIKLEIEPVVAG